MFKKCTKCGLNKNLNKFYKDKQKKDGLCSSCKECRRIHNQLPEIKEQRNKYNQSPKMKDWNAEYRKRPDVIERRREWERGEKRKDYNARPEVKARKKQYLKEHPELRKQGKGGISKKAFEKIKENFYWQCPICGESEPFFGQFWIWLVQDHIIPKSKGGAKYKKENIQPLCWDCNSKKSDKIYNNNKVF